MTNNKNSVARFTGWQLLSIWCVILALNILVLVGINRSIVSILKLLAW